jgi:hypothetical protein
LTADYSLIHINGEEFKDEISFAGEKFTLPAIRVIKELKEYKTLGSTCRMMCSPVYFIEMDRPIMNLGHFGESSLAIVTEWHEKERSLSRLRKFREPIVPLGEWDSIPSYNLIHKIVDDCLQELFGIDHLSCEV